MSLIKILVLCLLTVVAGLFATGIERIVWMFSGSGLVAVVPRSVYESIPDIACNRRYIEVKRDADGMMRYRCGDYWLLSTEKRSTELTENWRQVAAAAAGLASGHP